MKSYCENNKMNVFDIMPITFCVTVDTEKPSYVNFDLSEFVTTFEMLEDNRNIFNKLEQVNRENVSQLNHKICNLMKDVKIVVSDNFEIKQTKINVPTSKNSLPLTKIESFNFSKNKSYTKIKMPVSHYSGENFWILKATNLNRGRGIHVFKDLESLAGLIKKYTQVSSKAGNKRNKSQNKNTLPLKNVQIHQPNQR